MKHIRIVLTLTIVVLTASLLVFFAEAYTTPIIDEYNREQANIAKFEVFPNLEDLDELELAEGYDYTDTTINELFIVDGKGYIYTAEFIGYVAEVPIIYIIGIDMDGIITGYKTLIHKESPGYGIGIGYDSFYEQFIGKTVDELESGDIDAIAGTSNAPITTGALKDSLNKVMVFHKTEIQGLTVETKEERIDRLAYEIFSDATSHTDVTTDYLANDDITFIYEMYNEDTYLGNVYLVNAKGASFGGPTTFIEFLIGINTSDTFEGFRMIDDNETPGISDPFYLEAYASSYNGDPIEGEYTIDDVAGSTLTNSSLQIATLDVSNYHLEEYLGIVLERPDTVPADPADLLLAYPTGVTFNSIYEEHEYSEYIYDLYEVLDAGSNLIGHVYYGHINGFGGGVIEFTLGVDLTGTTQELTIIDSTESWDEAHSSQYSDYDGSEGYWPDTPWLDNFRDVTFASLLASPVDGVAGVSTTTDGMLEIVAGIAQYHIDNIEGGVE